MKKYIKSLIAIAFGAFCLVSCNKELPWASSVSVDKPSIEFNGTNAAEVKVNVTSDGDWIVFTSEDWITVTPSYGTGNGEITIAAKDNVNAYNELMGPRSTTISVIAGDSAIAAITAKQKGEAGLDTSTSYTLVEQASDITMGAAYLIVFKVGDKHMALKPFDGALESAYSYLFGTEVTPKDKKIEAGDASNGFLFEATDTDGQFRLFQSLGTYLYQDDSHANFYVTKTAATASEWKTAWQEDGSVKIMNATRSDKYLQWTSYNNAGTYSSDQNNAVTTAYLYKDSKPVSTEELSAQDATVAYDAESFEIAVTSNRTWKVRNHDEWITSFTPAYTTGTSGDGTISITFAQNDGNKARTATFLIIGEEKNIEVTLTQTALGRTIADLKAQITSENRNSQSPYTISLSSEKPAVVTYVPDAKNAFIEDETGGILLYLNNHGLTAGDKITGKLSGTGYLYNKLPEITSVGTEFEKTSGEAPAPAAITLADLFKNYDRYVNCHVKIDNVKFTEAIAGNTQNGKIVDSDNKNEIVLRAQTKTMNFAVGTVGNVVCIVTQYNDTKQLALYSEDDFTVTFAPKYLTVGTKTYNKSAAAGDVVINVTSNAAWTASSNAAWATAGSPVYASGTSGDGTVTISLAANTGEERTATITLSATDAEDVTVSIVQADVSAVKTKDIEIDGTDFIAAGAPSNTNITGDVTVTKGGLLSFLRMQVTQSQETMILGQ